MKKLWSDFKASINWVYAIGFAAMFNIVLFFEDWTFARFLGLNAVVCVFILCAFMVSRIKK
ncbi:MAG: hypothetical protein AABY15_02745 [Nanoarchaeota archaeon]